MSLTSTILLNLPIRLPVGKLRFVSFDDRRMAPVSSGQVASANERIHFANIEIVFNAIKSGEQTIIDISDFTRLSELTVRRALHELVDNGRITRDCKHARHRFAVKGES